MTSIVVFFTDDSGALQQLEDEWDLPNDHKLNLQIFLTIFYSIPSKVNPTATVAI